MEINTQGRQRQAAPAGHLVGIRHRAAVPVANAHGSGSLYRTWRAATNACTVIAKAPLKSRASKREVTLS